MSITKLKSKGLNKALTFSLPQRMVNAIEQCLEEDEAYFANYDELTSLYICLFNVFLLLNQKHRIYRILKLNSALHNNTV
jgi:hypothetical protein